MGVLQFVGQKLQRGCFLREGVQQTKAFRFSLAADTSRLQCAGGETMCRALLCSGQPWRDLWASFLGPREKLEVFAAQQSMFALAGSRESQKMRWVG